MNRLVFAVMVRKQGSEAIGPAAGAPIGPGFIIDALGEAVTDRHVSQRSAGIGDERRIRGRTESTGAERPEISFIQVALFFMKEPPSDRRRNRREAIIVLAIVLCVHVGFKLLGWGSQSLSWGQVVLVAPVAAAIYWAFASSFRKFAEEEGAGQVSDP